MERSKTSRPTKPKPSQSRSAAGSNRQPLIQARRRRTMTRRVRRFESALASFPVQEQIANTRRFFAFLGGTGWRWSKIASGLLFLAVVAAMGLAHNNEQWFVYAEDVEFQGLSVLKSDELYARLDVDGWNIFWLHPDTVRQALLQEPFVGEADVQVRLPGTIDIDVQEVNPVAVWVTNDGKYLLAPSGAARPLAEDQQERAEILPTIVDSLQEASALAGPTKPAMDPEILTGAMALLKTLPELNNEVRFNRSVGLNFPLSREAVWVYWGDGDQTELKLENLSAARTILDNGETSAQIVDIRYANRPYFR